MLRQHTIMAQHQISNGRTEKTVRPTEADMYLILVQDISFRF